MWTSATIARDTDTPTIATVTVVYTDDVTKETFKFSQRAETDKPGQYVNAARAALAAWQSKRTEVKSVEAQLLAALNS